MKTKSMSGLIMTCLLLCCASGASAADGVSLQTTAREMGEPQRTASEQEKPPATVDAKTDDGKVVADEAEATATRNWWKDNDTDGDGKISAMEAKANAGLDARFAEIDADGDGFVKLREYNDYYQRHVSRDVPPDAKR